jgi:general stress protein CsbA
MVYKESRCGQWMGFIIVLVFIIAAAFLGYFGHDKLAGLIIIAVVSLAIIFVLKKNPKESKKKDLSENSNEKD